MFSVSTTQSPPESVPNLAPGDQKPQGPPAPEKKSRFKRAMTPKDELPRILTEDEIIYPKIIDAVPKTKPQLLAFESPLLIHLPFFFIFTLTTDQWYMLFFNIAVSFLLGIFSVDMINKAFRLPQLKILFYVLAILGVAANVYLFVRAIGWYGVWEFREYPVFTRIWNRITG